MNSPCGKIGYGTIRGLSAWEKETAKTLRDVESMKEDLDGRMSILPCGSAAFAVKPGTIRSKTMVNAEYVYGSFDQVDELYNEISGGTDTIDRQTWLSGMKKLAPKVSSMDLNLLFNTVDQTSRGYISKADILKAFRNHLLESGWDVTKAIRAF